MVREKPNVVSSKVRYFHKELSQSKSNLIPFKKGHLREMSMVFTMARLTPKSSTQQSHQIKKQKNCEKEEKIKAIVPYLLNCKDKINILKNVKKLKGEKKLLMKVFLQKPLSYVWSYVKM